MFIPPARTDLAEHVPEYTVLHAPMLQIEDWKDLGLNSEVAVLFHPGEKLVLICGTRYAGEIKKSIFSAMNLLLPAKGVLPMHCSANTTGKNTAVFFGLSGTGKTTLSADPLRALVGDDEHGWSDEGVFNFEGVLLRQNDSSLPRGRTRDSCDNPSFWDGSRKRYPRRTRCSRF